MFKDFGTKDAIEGCIVEVEASNISGDGLDAGKVERGAPEVEGGHFGKVLGQEPGKIPLACSDVENGMPAPGQKTEQIGGSGGFLGADSVFPEIAHLSADRV